jgi:hypothetical protein
MSTAIFRNYLDIINENSREPVQLNEGVMDILKSIVPKVMKFLGGDTIKDIAEKVKQITGGDFTLSTENSIKVAKALGFDKIPAPNANKSQMTEGLAGNWQGRLIQLLWSIPVLQTVLNGISLYNTGSGIGPFDTNLGNNSLSVIGFILLMAAHTFWSSDSGSVGAMGRYGNKGFETTKGPTTL